MSENQTTFNQKLAAFATAFVPELVSSICKLAKKAQENPVIVHLLDVWYDSRSRYEAAYEAAILENLNEGLEHFTESVMTKIYKEKAFTARDLLQDYFMHNAFEKEEE